MGYGEHNGLVLPDNVLEATGDYVSPEQAAQHCVEAVWFRELLKGVDPRLDLVFVKAGAKAFPHSPRFYIVRKNEETVDSYWVIQSEDGEYCEPTERHFEKFLSGDVTRNPNLWREFKLQRETRMRNARKRREELHREFREKLMERLDFIYDGKGIVVDGAAKKKVG